MAKLARLLLVFLSGCEAAGGPLHTGGGHRAASTATAELGAHGVALGSRAPLGSNTVSAPASAGPIPTEELPGHGGAPRSKLPVLVLGGDVSFGRSVGQRLIEDSGFDPFSGVARWLAAGELRAVNLESVLSDQKGVTEHPHNPLVFSGPPLAASVLERAGIDVVSVANNHAWDYGKRGLFESLGHIARAGVVATGAGRDRGEPYEPAIVERHGIRFAFLAFTQVWNDGKLEEHPAARYVAGDDYEAMKRALRRARARADFVVVSLHASNEYVTLPRERARRFARGALVSGADLVFGHHPHVVQGVEWVHDRPILYSLGNLVFASRREGPQAANGAIALVRLERRVEGDGLAVASVELCPVALRSGLPEPGEPLAFASAIGAISKQLGGLSPEVTPRGCVDVPESDAPLPDERRHGFRPDPSDPEDTR